jgi:hypothetical protein
MDIIKIAEACGALVKQKNRFFDASISFSLTNLELLEENIRADEHTKASEELVLVKEERDRLLEERKLADAQIVPDRVHIKTELLWLIERDSPAQYVSDLSTSLQITSDPWKALKFPTKEAAEEMLYKSCYGKSSDWRILDHMFYM